MDKVYYWYTYLLFEYFKKKRHTCCVVIDDLYLACVSSHFYFYFFLFVSRVLRDTLVHLRYSAFFDWRSVFHALYTMHNTISLILLNRFEDPWWWRRRCSSFWSLLCSSPISPSSKPTYSVSLKRNPAWKLFGYNLKLTSSKKCEIERKLDWIQFFFGIVIFERQPAHHNIVIFIALF